MVVTKMNGPQVEISGTATLCFHEEGSRFQGSITAEDDTQFVIYGTKLQLEDEDQGQTLIDNCECKTLEDDNGVPVTFDMRIVDCEVGEEYSLERVHGRNGEFCTFSSASVNFTTNDVFRGHKAAMVTQNCLGQKMAGKNTTVYRGPIRLNYVATPRNVQWVL